MNIDDITKRIDDSFGTDIKDIFGRRIYPGDLVYYSGIDSRHVDLGIVSKLTKTGCKILNSNKLFGNNELCKVDGNENASLAYKEQHKKDLEQFYKDKKIEQATKRKSIVFIEKTPENKVFLGQTIFEFFNVKEMKEKMKSFMSTESKILVLCKDKDGDPYFSNDIENKDVYFQKLTNKMFYTSDPIHKIEYMTPESKDKWKEDIEERKKDLNEGINKSLTAFKRYDVQFISKKEDLKIGGYGIQAFFDDDFLFIAYDYYKKLCVDFSGNKFISFAYWWLSTLTEYFYKLSVYRYSYGYRDENSSRYLETFFNHDLFNDKLYEMYLFLKKSLQSI